MSSPRTALSAVVQDELAYNDMVRACRQELAYNEAHEEAKHCTLSEPDEVVQDQDFAKDATEDQVDANDSAGTAQEQQAPELILKLSHQGSIFRVRPSSSDLESVQAAVVGVVGEWSSCVVSIITHGNQPRPLSEEAWLQVLSEATLSRVCAPDPIIIRLHAERQLEPGTAVEAEKYPYELHPIVDIDNVTESAPYDGDVGSLPVQVREDDVGVPVHGGHVVQRLVSRLSSSLWGAVSILRAGSVHV